MNIVDQLKNLKLISIGKRKRAMAKAFFYQGKGQIFVNGRSIVEYFNNDNDIVKSIASPLALVDCNFYFNIVLLTTGGGFIGQTEAIRLAISKGLSHVNQQYLKILAKLCFLRRDSRIKERKKYGLKKARKASQYSKR